MTMTTSGAGTVTELRSIPPVPDSFPARHRNRTPPREYFCGTCWAWYVSECPEHGRALPRPAGTDPVVEQERRERAAAQAETLEGRNDAAALAEGPMVYALLKWARQVFDGVNEADLADWHADGRRLRAARTTIAPHLSPGLAVADEGSAAPVLATVAPRQVADVVAALAEPSPAVEDLALPVTTPPAKGSTGANKRR